MKIHVLALDGLFDTGLATLLDAFAVAGDLAASAGLARAPLAVSVAGVRRRVKTAQGLSVPVRYGAELPRPDIAIVAALGAKLPETLQAALARPDVAEAGQLLRGWHRRGTLVGAACTGTFVLAEVGLLDCQPATTTWWLAPLFRARYPQVALEESRVLVEARQAVTAGAALAHLDLALWLIRRVSPVLAAMVAKYLLIEPRPSQAAYVIPDHLAHADLLVERFERWARAHLAEVFSLQAATQVVGTSERTLSRRLRTVLGKSPLAYVQDLRVERAVHLLQTTAASVDQIAAQVGYADGTTLRSLLRRRLGRGARELRGRAPAGS